MIKVGQIYKSKNNTIFVVSDINKGFYSVVYKCGYAVTYDENTISMPFVFAELIAEYPTWREAVNSKEFRDE